jgi:uncharacterized membrane protein
MKDHRIVILTWEDPDKAGEALKKLRHWKDEKMITVVDAVVIVKDDEGKVKVHETEQLTTKKGLAWGGVAGFLVGAIIGGPIGGVIVGGALGAAAAKIDVGISKGLIQEISDSLHGASSAIIAEVESDNEDFLPSVIRQSDGKLFEFSVTAEEKADTEKTLAAATGSHQ